MNKAERKMEGRKIRNEFDKVVGIYLYRTNLLSVIYDVPAKNTYLTFEADVDAVSRRKVKKLHKQLKTALKRMK